MDKNMIFSVSPVRFSTWWRVFVVGLGGGAVAGCRWFQRWAFRAGGAVGFALAFCVFFKLVFKYLIVSVPLVYWVWAWRCFAKIRSKNKLKYK